MQCFENGIHSIDFKLESNIPIHKLTEIFFSSGSGLKGPFRA